MTGNVSKISGSFRAEPSRVAAENNRVAAENQRIQNEEERQNAESLRQDRYDSLFNRMEEGINAINATVSHASDAVQNANSSASRAESAAEGADTAAALANQKAELAHEKASLAQEKADLANEKAALAESKATAADTAAGKANSASESANSAKINADTAAEGANSAAAAANAAADRVTEPLQAKNITYDNSNSGLASKDVKTALDELQEKFQTERKRFNPIYCNALFGSAEGASITVSNAVEGTPLALTLYGKCTETLSDSSAEKSPDNPAVITGISESGSVTVTMCGKNLFDADTLYDKFLEKAGDNTWISDNVSFDGRNCVQCRQLGVVTDAVLFKGGKENTQYTFTFYHYVNSSNSLGPSYRIVYTDGTYEFVSPKKQKEWEKVVITSAAGKTVSRIVLSYQDSPYTTTYWDKSSMMLSVGATAAAYEPYEAQTISVPLSAPLYGIKHQTTGEWLVRDEIRVEDGKVQLAHNIEKYEITGDEQYITSINTTLCAIIPVDWNVIAIPNNSKMCYAVISTHIKSTGVYNTGINLGYQGDDVSQIKINIPTNYTGITSADTNDERQTKLRAWLSGLYNSGTPLTCYYAVEVPTVTDITDTEAGQALLALVSQNGDTITNSEGADMEITYNRDINKALAEINNAIIALGGTI